MKKIGVALYATALVTAAFAAPAIGQTSTLSCMPAMSVVTPGSSVNFFVSGGNGTFTFSGNNVATTTTTNTVFPVSFSNTGTNSFVVASGGQTATCSVNVQPASAGATSCILPSGTITAGTPATFTATGGNGNFIWSASDLSISSPAGTSFSANYSTPGIHTLTVTSNGTSASCTFNVAPAISTGSLTCSPSSQSANVGQLVHFTATGGNGNYVWSATDLVLSNPTGSGFSATYGAAGTHSVTVTSNGQTSTCLVNVLSSGTTPGLPNTGFAPVQ